MNKHKRRRGRPVGGKLPPPVREYYRTLMRERRANKVAETVTGKKGGK